MAIAQKLQQVKGLETPKKQTFKTQQLKNLQEKVRARQAEEALKNEAKRLDTEIKNNNFLGSLSNFENQYNAIPEEIRKYMSITPSFVKSELQNRINLVQSLIQDATKQAKEFSKSKNKPARDEQQARVKGYQEGLAQLQQGNLMPISDIKSYANSLGNYAYSKRKAKLAKKAQKTELLKTGEVTKINYEKGIVTVSGKKISVPKSQLKTVKLSSVKRAKAQSQIKVIENKLNQNKALSVQDFQNARSLGISSSQLLKLAGQADTAARKKEQQIKLYNSELDKAQKGVKPNVTKLLREGVITGQQATDIVRAYELSPSELNKIRNKNFNLLWEKLQKPTVRVDYATQVKAFKTTVNKELTNNFLKPVPLGNSLRTFELALANLKKLQKEFKTPVLKGVSDSIKKQILSVEYKALTGQSMTPREIALYQSNLAKLNNQIAKQQRQVLLKLVKSPVNYGKSLRIRYERGEKNPLLNDVKSFTKGFKNTAVDIWVDLGKLAFRGLKKGGEASIKAAFNYGVRITKEAQKGNFVIDDDLKKIGQTIWKGAKTAAAKEEAIRKFIVKNPEKSALIAGAAALSGLVFIGTTGTKISRLTAAAYAKNPAYFFGQAIGFVTPLRKIPGVGKSVKALRTYLRTEKYSKNAYEITQNLAKGTAKIKGNINGVLKNGKKFKTTYRLTYNIKNKKVTGRVVYNIEKEKPITQNVRFNEKVGYFVDVASGEKVGKLGLPIQSQSIKITETKIIPKSKALVLKGSFDLSKQKFDVVTTITRIINTSKKTIVKRSEVLLVVDNKTKKVIKGFAKQAIKTTKKGRATIDKGLTQTQINQLEKFLKSIQYDKTLLGGLDKRTRLARALGLRKTDPTIKAIENIVDSEGIVKGFIRRAGKAKFKGVTVIGKKPKPKKKLKIKIEFRKGGSLRSNKKASVSIFRNDSVLIKKPISGNKYKRIKFTMPKLVAPLPVSKVKLRGLGLIKLEEKLRKNLKTFKQLASAKDVEITKVQNSLRDIAQTVKKINIKLQEAQQIKIQTTKPKAQPKAKLKQVTTKKVKPRAVKIRGKFKTPGKLPKKILLPKFGDVLPRGTRLAFNIRIANKIYPIRKPINTALQRAVTIVLRDKKLRRFDIIIAGTTKQKDKAQRPKGLERFKGTKGNRVYTFIQKKK